MLYMQQVTGVRRLLQEAAIYSSTAPSTIWSTRVDAGITISSAVAPAQLDQDQASDVSSSFDTINHFSPSVAIIMVALLSAFFFMGFFSLYVRRCNDSPSDARASLRRVNELNEEHQTQQGLDPDILQHLPLVAYSSAKKKGSNAQCAVCLTDFEENEPLRQLPACTHAFHQACIDMWLFSHSTCPLCRHSIAVSSGSTSLQWGGSASFRQFSILGGQADGSGQQQSSVTDEAGTAMRRLERERSDMIPGMRRSHSLEMIVAGGHSNPFEMNVYNVLSFSGERDANCNGYENSPPAVLATPTMGHIYEDVNESNSISHNTEWRWPWAAHLTRSNSTGHFIQLGRVNEANAQLQAGSSLTSRMECLLRR